MAKERLLEVRLTLKDLRSIRDLEIDHECMPMNERADGTIVMDAIATESTVAKLYGMEASGVQVEVLRDETADIPSVKQLVSTANRYADGSLPRGAGKRGV